MKKYKVIVTPRARQDIKAYVDYIKNTYKNPQAARSVFEDYDIVSITNIYHDLEDFESKLDR